LIVDPLRLLILATMALTSPMAIEPVRAQAGPAPPPPNAGPPPRATISPVYDLQQLPATKGTVFRYTLTPRGDIDGLILIDGTEVLFPPHLSTQLVHAIKPGDSVTVRGLKALSTPLVAAISITNDDSGQTVVDNGPAGGPGRGPREAPQALSVQGRVQITLHGPRGEINGAMLEDGTILRLPPPEAARLAALLTPSQVIVAQGDGLTTAMGRVVDVQAIGSSQAQLNFVQRPEPPPGKRSLYR
jgi:hypothetical protein